jgi:hypothetical protein
MSDTPTEPTTPEPEPEDEPRTPEPDEEPVDRHLGPLDDDEDGRWLREDDPRRIEAERRRGRRFDPVR